VGFSSATLPAAEFSLTFLVNNNSGSWRIQIAGTSIPGGTITVGKAFQASNGTYTGGGGSSDVPRSPFIFTTGQSYPVTALVQGDCGSDSRTLDFVWSLSH
jgi:hypothetical protein